MNKYQKVINQFTKDNIKWPVFEEATSFYKTRKKLKFDIKNKGDFKDLVKHKNIDKRLKQNVFLDKED